MNNEQTELVERIVIEYANLSGRESANRAQFREIVAKIISTHHRQALEKVMEGVEELKMEEFIEAFDNDGHRYQIPKDKLLDWFAFNEIPEGDERGWDVPEYAERIDGMPIHQTAGYNRGLDDALAIIREEI